MHELAGQGCYFGKTVIKNAFQIIPIQSNDHGLLGMHRQDSCYFDNCMPTSFASSSRTFVIFLHCS